ncbi:MAG: hypothetical protein ACLU38_07805 [Dysosmobacter sp.]
MAIAGSDSGGRAFHRLCRYRRLSALAVWADGLTSHLLKGAERLRTLSPEKHHHSDPGAAQRLFADGSGHPGQRGAGGPRRTQQQELVSLFAADGMTLDPALIPTDTAVSTYALIRDETAERKAAAFSREIIWSAPLRAA